jgi:hypothetical protein
MLTSAAKSEPRWRARHKSISSWGGPHTFLGKFPLDRPHAVSLPPTSPARPPLPPTPRQLAPDEGTVRGRGRRWRAGATERGRRLRAGAREKAGARRRWPDARAEARERPDARAVAWEGMRGAAGSPRQQGGRRGLSSLVQCLPSAPNICHSANFFFFAFVLFFK